jgi:hypothetical protein
MDAHRNVHNYLRKSSDRVEQFLGLRDWRENWMSAEKRGYGFGAFITDQFGLQMEKLGYHYKGLEDSELERHDELNYSLYRLVFFSRNKLGISF